VKQAEGKVEQRSESFFLSLNLNLPTTLVGENELEPWTRVTINDHSLQEHRHWSDPQPAVSVERAINHIFLFRF
jgi:hypothetical protein